MIFLKQWGKCNKDLNSRQWRNLVFQLRRSDLDCVELLLVNNNNNNNNNNNETILKNKDYDKNASEFLNNNSSSDGYSRNFLGETITHSKF